MPLLKDVLSFDAPDAAFYVWIKVPDGYTSAGFCGDLLDKVGIVATPGTGFGKSGEGYFSQDFIGFKRRGEHGDKKLIRRNPALTTLRLCSEPSVERCCHHRQFRGRVGVGQAPAKGAAVADLRMGNIGHGLVDEGLVFLDKRTAGHLGLSGHRTNSKFSILCADVAQFVELIQIDQDCWLRYPEIHGRDQALPTCERLGFIAVLSFARERIF